MALAQQPRNFTCHPSAPPQATSSASSGAPVTCTLSTPKTTPHHRPRRRTSTTEFDGQSALAGVLDDPLSHRRHAQSTAHDCRVIDHPLCDRVPPRLGNPRSTRSFMAAQSNLRKTAAEAAIAAFADKWKTFFKTRWRSTSRATRVLATLLLTLSIVAGAEGTRRRWKRQHDESEQGRKLVRTNSWLHNKDGSRTIYVPYKEGTSKVIINTTKPLTFEAHRRLFLNPPRVSGLGHGTVPSAQTKPGLNLAFLHQFLSLMSIMIPRWSSKEAGLLLSHGVFLMLRTYLSLVVARLDGELVRDLVAGNGKAFIWGILKWCGLGGFASYTNAMIKYLESKVSIAFRTRLTRYIHDLYLNDNLNYYKLSNLDGGVGHGADQFITQDLTLFCAAAANLYSSLGKPFVDLCVFNFQLYRSLGPLALSGLLSNYFLTASILRRLSPPFGKLKAVEGRKEGDFRGLHARLIANAEEVAFYGGAEMEKTFLNKEYKSLKSWMEGIYMLKIRYNILEDFILKYSWSAYGYLLASLPVFLPAWGGVGGAAEMLESVAKGGRERNRMKDFITNKRLMLSLADAGGRMMYSIKDLAELAGYTSRVYTLISTLHRVHANAYYVRGGQNELYSLSDVQGTIQKGFDGVRFEQVPVAAPGLWPQGGEELTESLSMIVRSGEHLLISGPNGVGKTAVSRILAGLWPVYRGLVSRPKSIGQDGIMFLPQRPYLSPGTLRDQVIYPDGHVDMKEKRKSEDDLKRILEEAKLGYLPDREGGWDTRKEWKDVLSGGEKQRMQFARLLYHEPQYAVIDEGTSAVSSDVEGLLYETCKEKGITLITISTRASLKKYHTYNLVLGMGDQGDEWEFERIGTEREKLQVEKELQELRERLAQVDEWKKRRDDIEQELAAVWTDKGESLEAPDYVDIAGEQQGEPEEGDDEVGGEEELISAGTDAADVYEEAGETAAEEEEADEAEEAKEAEEEEEEADEKEIEEIEAVVSSTAEDSAGHQIAHA
ncbi:ATP-binding cassette long-chain fatty acid transporter pxa1 [Purpureocillium takamizusanense]|uniref:ATP-binding cassette long-chain fatty acid transporter pxa1 n=1 Tax=Purpureocillium takamizusanense TaxID=2060973 RepID=A0A9Q8QPS5_9HYPO|nr:ATP-binding cassette long-chain fatty acid transporter pxa1 [Purpureocillium takamizusanense]UNI23650.1 ATP-binding cassette long-chain fatty acid transporter pxa1 [Purpureocillium takamizusanense]